MLANTYHLLLQPGPDLVKRSGGLHSFMAWDGPILTDSGGFQVFSLKHKEITADGVRFKNEVDGSEVMLTPERAIELQHVLGADIIMAFDECTPYPATPELAKRGVEHSLAWLERCVAAHRGSEQALFPIVQGSVYPELRELSARETVRVDSPGYAIGGVSVGEGLEELKRIVSIAAPLLPERQAPLPDGRRPARGPGRVRRARHRHVRLRDPDPLRALRDPVHAPRPDPHERAALSARHVSGRHELRLLRLQDLHARVRAPPVRRERDPGHDPRRHPQRALLPAA